MTDLNLPAKIRAGDTLKFTDTVTDYPAVDGWTLHYIFSNASHTATFSVSGTEYAFVVAAADTAKWNAGSYQWAAYVDGVSSQRFTVGSGRVELLPNIVNGPTDQRAHVEKVIAAIEAVLENKASKDIESVTINGQWVKRMSPEHLLAWRATYKAELRTLIRAEQIANGKSVSGTVLVSMKS